MSKFLSNLFASQVQDKIDDDNDAFDAFSEVMLSWRDGGADPAELVGVMKDFISELTVEDDEEPEETPAPKRTAAKKAAPKSAPAKSAPAKKPGKSATTTAAELDMSDVRAWATAEGYDVAPRGRISREIIDAYLEEINK